MKSKPSPLIPINLGPAMHPRVRRLAEQLQLLVEDRARELFDETLRRAVRTREDAEVDQPGKKP